MKTNILIVLVFIFQVSTTSCSKKVLSSFNMKDKYYTNYKVEKISEVGTVYVIDLIKNDSTFRVLTEHLKNPNKINLTKNEVDDCKTNVIKEGEWYQLKLDTLYERQLKQNFIPNAGVHFYIEYNGSNIEVKFNQILYTTKNLKGLCLIQNR